MPVPPGWPETESPALTLLELTLLPVRWDSAANDDCGSGAEAPAENVDGSAEAGADTTVPDMPAGANEGGTDCASAATLGSSAVCDENSASSASWRAWNDSFAGAKD